MKKRKGAWLSVLITIAILLSAAASACTSEKQPARSFSTVPVFSNNISVNYSSFSPSSIMVASGTQVKWNNNDKISYFIVGDNQPFAFDIPAAGSFSMTFTDPGVFSYHCRNCPSMHGTITVLSGVTCQSLPAVPTNETYLTPGTVSSLPDGTSQLQIDDVAAKVRPSVVEINAQTASYDISGNQVTNTLSGSGWIFGKNGLIITNNHVVAGATDIAVTTDNGQTYPAETVVSDPVSDLAVIDIGIHNLPPLTMIDSSTIKIGDHVIAVGFIPGDGITVAAGTVLNTNATFTVLNRETLYNTLQTTARITYGNSGSPLTNMDGDVIGIVTGATLTAGTNKVVSGYAISSNTALPVIHDLIQNSYVSRAWIGVTVSDVDQVVAAGYNPEVADGAFVIKVDAASPAEKSGLKAGDVIVGLDGKTITSADDLVQATRLCKVGQTIMITLYRNSMELNTLLTTTQNPAP